LVLRDTEALADRAKVVIVTAVKDYTPQASFVDCIKAAFGQGMNHVFVGTSAAGLNSKLQLALGRQESADNPGSFLEVQKLVRTKVESNFDIQEHSHLGSVVHTAEPHKYSRYLQLLETT
jgi:hypothetical protein